MVLAREPEKTREGNNAANTSTRTSPRYFEAPFVFLPNFPSQHETLQFYLQSIMITLVIHETSSDLFALCNRISIGILLRVFTDRIRFISNPTHIIIGERKEF